MADPMLKEKIRDSLRRAVFNDPQDVVDVSDGEVGDNVHLVVVSPKFDGRRNREKTDLIWSQLTQLLPPEEWGKITLTIGVSPAEMNGATIEDIKVGM